MDYHNIDWGTYEGPQKTKRDSFIFRRRYYEYYVTLEEKHGVKVALAYIEAICRYALDEELPEDLHPEAEGYFNLVKAQINRDITVYKKKRR